MDTQFAPDYKVHAYNCDKCTTTVKNRIRDYNETYRPEFLDVEPCSCMDDWKRELTTPYPALMDRIPRQLEQIRTFLSQPNVFSILGNH